MKSIFFTIAVILFLLYGGCKRTPVEPKVTRLGIFYASLDTSVIQSVHVTLGTTRDTIVDSRGYVRVVTLPTASLCVQSRMWTNPRIDTSRIRNDYGIWRDYPTGFYSGTICDSSNGFDLKWYPLNDNQKIVYFQFEATVFQPMNKMKSLIVGTVGVRVRK